MLAQQIIQTNFPLINLYDKVSFAIQLMEDYEVLHLPVVGEEKFVGIVSKEDLLDANETAPVAALQENFMKAFVKADEFFLAALKQLAHHQLSLIAVINEQIEVLGVITQTQLVQQLSRFVGNDERGGIIVLETEKRHFSFGEISRLVETNDAYITQLNTYAEEDTGLIIVTIKINKPEISDIVSTLQRFDYSIRFYFGEEHYTNELKDNFNQLMHYLNI